MTPQKYCENKVKNSGSSFYYSFLFLDKIKQREIFALYAFCREVDDIVDNIADANIARIKLAWWANDLEKCFTPNNIPEHPVNKELKLVINKYNIKKNIFDDLLQGMQMDLDKYKYQSMNDLLKYCYCVAGTVGIVCVNIFGYKENNTFEYAKNLANFLQLVNILRDFSEDYNKYNRVYIPEDLLLKHQISKTDLENLLDNKINNNNLKNNIKLNNFKSLITELLNKAEDYYFKYKSIISKKDLKNQFPGFIMGEIYKAIFDKIKKNNLAILKENKISVNPLKKLYIAYSTNKYIHKTCKL